MRHPLSAAEAKVAAVDSLRAEGMTAAAACAEVGMSTASYYRARRSIGKARCTGRVQPPARAARLQAPRAQWPAPAEPSAWLHLAPPWRTSDPSSFSPFAVLKPELRRPPARRKAPATPTISAQLAPVIECLATAPSQPLRLRASLAHRDLSPRGGALNGLPAAPTWLRHMGPIMALAVIAGLFGMSLTRTAADSAAMLPSTSAAEARMVAGAE